MIISNPLPTLERVPTELFRPYQKPNCFPVDVEHQI